jgi:hypothetical protein
MMLTGNAKVLNHNYAGESMLKLHAQICCCGLLPGNVKNMCFLNAILQCLYHTPTLRRNLALACESGGAQHGKRPAEFLFFCHFKSRINCMSRVASNMCYFHP